MLMLAVVMEDGEDLASCRRSAAQRDKGLN